MFFECAIPAALVFHTDELIKHLADTGKWRIPKAGEKGDTPWGQGPFRFRLLHNKGVARGVMKEHPECVKWVSLSLSGVLAFLMIALASDRKKQPGKAVMLTGLSFMLGGALSNTKDRMTKGYVVDYFSFRKGSKALKELVWNLSDMGILLGSVLAVVSSFFTEERSGDTSVSGMCRDGIAAEK